MKHAYSTTSRRGLTLIEILFGLVIVIVLLLIAWPVIRGVGDISRLRKAGKQVRDDISRTRIDSMASGRIYVIHFQPESNVYQVGPYEVNDPLLEATASDLEDPTSWLAQGRRWGGESREMPEDIRFELGDFQVEVPEGIKEQLERPVAPSGVGEGTSLMFYPDGTISDGMILLRGPGDHFIEIRVRGIEGTVFVGQPYESQ